MQLNCKNLTANNQNTFDLHDFKLTLWHKEGEPGNANRLKINIKNFEVELLPSKGLSVGQCIYDGDEIFWTPPTGLPDAENLDLFSDEISIAGKPSLGSSYLKTFMGGIEFYGMRNWGMPYINKEDSVLNPLHGETSNIPLDSVEIEFDEKLQSLIIKGKLVYRDFEKKNKSPWYESGEKLFEIEKRYFISFHEEPILRLEDDIRNISDLELVPDFGYHITFKPEESSMLMVPSQEVEERSGGQIPCELQSWYASENNKIRKETGIIHRKLKQIAHNNHTDSFAMVVRPHSCPVLVSFRQLPYFQTWFCSGGANSTEFTYTANGKPVFDKNWDGMGIELGSSALDHNGNTDPSVKTVPKLKPGENYIQTIQITVPVKEKTSELLAEIQEYNKGRKLIK